MSLAKFLDLISRQSLFLAQIARLRADDPYEGSLGQDRLRYLERMTIDEGFFRQELGIRPGQQIPEGLREQYHPAATARQNELAASRTYVNCWHINPVESASLWSVYTNQGEGVAVQSSVGSLVDALGARTKEITIAPVRYINHRTFKLGPSFENAAFYKRQSFKAEKELRIRYLLPLDRCISSRSEGHRVWSPPPGIQIPIDCVKLIEHIYISPALGDWFRETVEQVVQKMGLNVSVTKSSLGEPRIL